MAETSGTIRRNVRLFAVRSGPLTRASDRIQALARLLVVVAVLATIPIAVALSVTTYDTVHAREAAAARSMRTTTARSWPMPGSRRTSVRPTTALRRRR
jgi:hypothetical protein